MQLYNPRVFSESSRIWGPSSQLWVTAEEASMATKEALRSPLLACTRESETSFQRKNDIMLCKTRIRLVLTFEINYQKKLKKILKADVNRPNFLLYVAGFDFIILM